MKDILAAVKDGKLKFLMTSATQSNSGASAYLAMLSSALGGKEVIEPGDLDNPDVRDTVKRAAAGRRALVRLVGLARRPLCRLREQGHRLRRDVELRGDAEGNQRQAASRWARSRSTPSIPADGVAVGDSPLGFIDHGRGAGRRKVLHRPARLSAVGRGAQAHRRHRPAPAARRLGDPGRGRAGLELRSGQTGDVDPHAGAGGDPQGARPLPGGACASRR